jgi:serine/threonine-protein kinase
MPPSAVADMIGRVLAGRYRLLAPIGAGGSGRVYVADDVRLRRQVAVKVLHSVLADDAGFLRRFRSEAQLAASLHHPHIMTVFDWGEDEGVPFMVLELLKGGSLRGVIDMGGPLSPSQTAHVGRQVATALRYAHQRGLVHRDIKPANLIFDEHGLVRVADFGLARALAEASWTEPSGMVMGTARYAAPEQASGAPLDARADLYSLAIVLVEAATGQVPIVADTAIGTLAARSTRSIDAPAEMGRLGAIVERAGRSNPDERYPDAATMGAALSDATRQLPPPAPLRLAGLGEALDDPNPTRVGGTNAMAVFDQDRGSRDSTASDDSIPLAVVAEEDPLPFRRSAIPYVVGVAIVVAVVVGLVALAGALGGGAPTVAVPSLVGTHASSAAVTATEGGLLMKVTERRTSDDPPGLVIAQDPAPGEFLEDGGEIDVVVSRGPPPVDIPPVAGQPAADAQTALEAAGFVVAVEKRFDENVPRDTVIGTDPPDGKARPETTIKLIVSDGPAPIAIPPVAGKSYEEAAATIEDLGFDAVRRDDFSVNVEEGVVVGTEPGEGEKAPRGSQVTVIVSKGPQLVEIPDLVGETVEDASAKLEELGLVPDVQRFRPGRIVRATDPDEGESVPVGSTVTLFL